MFRWLIAATVLGAVLVPDVRARDEERARGERAAREAATEQMAEQIGELDQFLDEGEGAGENDAGLEAVQQQIEALERQRGELERRADRLREFGEVRARAKEMLADASARLAELAAQAGEPELPPKRREMLATMREEAAAQAKVARQVLALEGADGLDKAHNLLFEWEAVQTRRRMIDEPKLLWAAEIAEMVEAAAGRGNPPKALELIEQAKAIREQAVADAEKLYDLWLARAKAERKLRALQREFGRVMGEGRTPERAKEPPG